MKSIYIDTQGHPCTPEKAWCMVKITHATYDVASQKWMHHLDKGSQKKVGKQWLMLPSENPLSKGYRAHKSVKEEQKKMQAFYEE